MRRLQLIALVVLLLLVAGGGLFFVMIKRAMPDPNVRLEIVAAGGGAYWIRGGVSNMGFIVTNSTVIVIDSEFYEQTATNAVAAIRRITDKPVRHVIVTHSDPDHVNGLPSFPGGVEVIAHPNARAEMIAALDSWIPSPASPSQRLRDYLPTRLVSSAIDLNLDGVPIRLLHVAPAHTDGDVIVYLPVQRIAFAGDILTPEVGPYPGIHLNKHGSSLGWIQTVRALLQLDATLFVSGHGSPVDRSELQARLRLAEWRRAQIAQLVAAGRTLDQIKTELHDTPLLGAASRFPTFIETTYEELTR